MESWVNHLSPYFSYFKDRAWIVEVFVVVFLTLFFAHAVSITLRKLIPLLKKSRTVWDDTLFEALLSPAYWLIWILGLTFAADIVGLEGTNVALFELVSPLRALGIVAMVAWFLIRFVSFAEQNFITGRIGNDKIDKTTVFALGKIFRGAIIITAVLVGMQSVGIQISGVLAVGGFGGAVVAFSAKDLLANYFGGLMLHLDRPFSVGDWVRSPDRQIEGVVEYIGWRLCRIRTFDKRPLYVPNSLLSNIAIENPSRMTNRRIYTRIGLRYDDAAKLATVIEQVKIMLRNHPDIDTSQTLIVNLVNFAPSSLEFMVYVFTKTTNWVKFQEVQQDVFLKIINIILENGAQCAYPTSTVHLPEMAMAAQEPVVEQLESCYQLNNSSRSI